jgi:ATP-dependent DNA helicase PIF1
MRAQGASDQFKNWLLEIGDGTGAVPAGTSEDCIALPSNICLQEHQMDELIEHTFGQTIGGNIGNSVASILTTTNNDAFAINDKVFSKFVTAINQQNPTLASAVKVYYSQDSMRGMSQNSENAIETDDIVAQAQVEYLHSQTPSGLPRHKLELAKGVPIVLLRNICTMKGLCNGTRLIVEDLKDHVIFAKISTGAYAGQSVMIHRMALATSMTPGSQFELVRLQFPIRMAFAMTINKAQGQTFDRVGLYLSSPVFAHGQLYVALSRVRRFDDIRVLIKNSYEQGFLPDGTAFTKNIVYKEVFAMQ